MKSTSSMTHMMTQHVLFKIAGNSNKVISENSSRCVLNIVKYVHSIKIITNICEQKILKANNVRVLVSQCIYIIICSYKNNLIQHIYYSHLHFNKSSLFIDS